MYTDEMIEHMIEQLRTAGHSESEIRTIILEDLECEKRIQKEAYAEWLECLVKMWNAVDKDVDDKRLAIYAEQFKAIPLGLLEKAVDRAIRNNGSYMSVPSVGALWQAIKQETGNHTHIDVMGSINLWIDSEDARFERQIYRFMNNDLIPFYFKQWGGVSKKQAGRVLDGQLWDEYPTES